MFIKRKINPNKIFEIINRRSFIKRYTTLIIALFIVALSYNLFFLPNNIVFGGVSGLAIIVAKNTTIEPSFFIMISSIVLLILSFILLGFEKTKGSIIGSIMFPIFVKITADFIKIIDLQPKFSHDDLLLVIIFGSVIYSFAYGIILREGFSTGGTDIINQITVKYFKVSLGTALIFNDGLIVLSGLIFFGPLSVMYALLVLYIISVLMDRVILGISEGKMFYIITDEDNKVRDYIIENLKTGLTIFDAEGGFLQNKKHVLMCVIPSKDYFRLKEGILEIDSNAFFIATDAYQVSNN